MVNSITLEFTPKPQGLLNRIKASITGDRPTRFSPLEAPLIAHSIDWAIGMESDRLGLNYELLPLSPPELGKLGDKDYVKEYEATMAPGTKFEFYGTLVGSLNRSAESRAGEPEKITLDLTIGYGEIPDSLVKRLQGVQHKDLTKSYTPFM